jgi:phosphoenolpyruvate carboxykinase (ATP)
MAPLKSHPALEALGLADLKEIYWQPQPPELYEQAVIRNEGAIADMGPLVVNTGSFTGRSPKDKFFVEEESTKNNIWWSEFNQKFDADKFNGLRLKMLNYFKGRSVFVQNCYAGANLDYRLPVRVITEMAWHSLFTRNMFIQPDGEDTLDDFKPEFTVLQAPNFNALPAEDGTRTPIFALISFEQRLVLIGGTHYTGEIKKGMFSIMNYLLPLRGVLPMHCSATEGEDGDTALFFGLSGTGKTTLSSDPTRKLIGDDEHGWDDSGVFNFEGGCYAKVINLSAEGEPEIYRTTRMFGTILENVVIDPETRVPDLTDKKFTENTRASYPIHFIPNIKPEGRGGHPKAIIFLTADASGIMPPVSKLTREQAMYHFLSGYTAKVAGTESGLGAEPQATFSTCFGAPFLPMHPKVYADLLGKKMTEQGASVWLVNTGWTGGPYGVGKRMSLAHTRRIVRAILEGDLANVETQAEPFFGLNIPTTCPEVPAEILNPRNTWPDKSAYDAKARELTQLFVNNFEKKFSGAVDQAIVEAGPHLP